MARSTATRDTAHPKRRHWADLVAIVAGVGSLSQAMWGASMFGQDVTDRGLGYNWLVYAMSGALAIGSLFLAQRRRALARIPLVVAGLLLATTPFVYRDKPALPITVSLVLAAMMLLAAPFIGRMPRHLHSS